MESFIKTMIFYPHFETVDVLNILSIIKHYAKDFDITLVVIKFNWIFCSWKCTRIPAYPVYRIPVCSYSTYHTEHSRACASIYSYEEFCPVRIFLSSVRYHTVRQKLETACVQICTYVYGTCFWYRIVQKPRSRWCWHAAFFEYVRMRQRRYIFLLCVKECCTRLPFSLCTVRREERDTLLYVEIVRIP